MEPIATYVVNLPSLEHYSEQDDLCRSLATKLRNLRLFALATDPEAFGSSYEVEAQRGLDQTLDRLRNPQADHFLVVGRSIHAVHNSMSVSIDDYVERLVEAEWLGMIVLNGPVRSTSFVTSAEPKLHGQIQSETKESMPSPESESSLLLTYHLNGTFVHPRLRRGGVGRSLLGAALTKARSNAQKLGLNMRCEVLVDSENQNAQRLYKDAGFLVTGEEIYMQLSRDQTNESTEKVAWRLELTDLYKKH